MDTVEPTDSLGDYGEIPAEKPAKKGKPRPEDMSPTERANLAAFMSPELLKNIGAKVRDRYDRDLQSREPRMKQLTALQKMYALIAEKKNLPWQNCANIKTPNLTGPVLQIQARLYDMIWPATGRVFNVVPATIEDQQFSHHAEAFANSYVRYKMPYMSQGLSSTLHGKCLYGSAFRRTSWDAYEGKVRSDSVPIDDFVVAYSFRSKDPSLSDVPRYTMRQHMSEYEIRQHAARGLYVQTELLKRDDSGDTEKTEFREMADKIDGLSSEDDIEDDNKIRQILEQHCTWRLPNQPKTHPAFDGQEHHVYIVVDAFSRTVLRMSLREEDDPDDKRRFDRQAQAYAKYEADLATYEASLSAPPQAGVMDMSVPPQMGAMDASMPVDPMIAAMSEVDALTPGSPPLMGPGQAPMMGPGGRFSAGDRVTVRGTPHTPGQKAGVVKIAKGDTYGIQFDGSSQVHKWYTGDELEGGAQPSASLAPMMGAAPMAPPPMPVEPEPVPKPLPIRKRQICFFTHYKCFESDGFYGLGYGDLLYGLVLATNTVINQWVDGQALKNSKPAFMSRQSRMARGTINTGPGQFNEIDVPMGSIKDSIMFLDPPQSDPGTVPLIKMLDGMRDVIAGNGDLMSGQAPGSNQTKAGMQILNEQMMAPITVLARQTKEEFRHELDKIWRCWGVFLEDEDVADVIGDAGQPMRIPIGKWMFTPSVHLVPASDPRMKSQRLEDLQGLTQFVMSMPVIAQNPQVGGPIMLKLAEMVLRVYPDGEALIPLLQPPPPPPPQPKAQLEENVGFLRGEDSPVHPADDDDAHMAEVDMFLNSPDGQALDPKGKLMAMNHKRLHVASRLQKRGQAFGQGNAFGPQAGGPPGMAGPPGFGPPAGAPPA